MPVLFSAIVKVRDWQALKQLHTEVIITKTKAMKAVGCRVYRDPSNASQALLLIELVDPDDVFEIRATVVEQLGSLKKLRLIDDRVWEPTNWEAIESVPKGALETQ